MNELKQKNTNFILNIIIYLTIGFLVRILAGFEAATLVLFAILIASNMWGK